MNKRGRKIGSKQTVPRPGTFNAALCTIAPGESRFFEPANTLSFLRRVYTPKSRQPANMQSMNFVAERYTAVSATKFGDIRYLVKVTRTS